MTLLNIATDIALPDGLVGADNDGNITSEAVTQLAGLVEAHLSTPGSEFSAVEITVLGVDEASVRVKVQGRSAEMPKKRRALGNII